MLMNYDIIVSGAGLVGVSLATALKNTPFKVAVLETHIPLQSNDDIRPLSLAYSSQKILDTFGVWPSMADLAAPIQTVHVSEQNRLGFLYFRAAEENVPALGYVLTFAELQTRLYQTAAQMQQVKFISMQKLTGIRYQSGKIEVTVQTLEGEKKLTAELLVAADGAHSPTRKLLGISAVEYPSQEIALTLAVEFSQSHQNTAYERFTDQGILAVLPQKNPHSGRVIWTISRALGEEVSDWPDAQLAEHLSAAMQQRLGKWTITHRGKLFPLQKVLAEQQYRPGAVLLGNAAHTIYPLAAQGFNLGLRDAATLAEILVNARENQQPLGDEPVLKSYVDWRCSDQRWIDGLTSGVSQLFGCHLPGLGRFRGAGLLMTNLLPPLKHRLAKRLLGLSGKCPKLVRGIRL